MALTKNQIKRDKAKYYIWSIAYLNRMAVDEDAVLDELLKNYTIDDVIKYLADTEKELLKNIL